MLFKLNYWTKQRLAWNGGLLASAAPPGADDTPTRHSGDRRYLLANYKCAGGTISDARPLFELAILVDDLFVDSGRTNSALLPPLRVRTLVPQIAKRVIVVSRVSNCAVYDCQDD